MLVLQVSLVLIPKSFGHPVSLPGCSLIFLGCLVPFVIIGDSVVIGIIVFFAGLFSHQLVIII
jgi:hypothetical protein